MESACKTCGKKFRTFPSAIARGDGKYCSSKCIKRGENLKAGPSHPRWKGGRYIDANGYVKILVGPHKYRPEHVVVMERILGRPIRYPEEHVHHKNRIRSDNRPENLEVKTPLFHSRAHAPYELREGTWWKQCRDCKQWKPLENYYIKRIKGRPDTHFSRCKPCYSCYVNHKD